MIEEPLQVKERLLTDAQLRHGLDENPWMWASTGPLADRISRLVAKTGPCLAPGESLVVTVHQTCGSVWRLRLGAKGPGRFGDAAERAWNSATVALNRCVPVLWRSLRDTQAATPGISLLDSLPRPRQVATPPGLLDGASFGVTFLLALASYVLGQSLPTDLAASAGLDSSGRVSTVDAIEDKVTTLMCVAPRVRRFAVARSDAERAQRAATAASAQLGTLAMQVLPLDTAWDALRAAFGGDLEDLVVRVGSDGARRSELVAAFFRLAMSGRRAVLDWTPVERAARLALEHWSDLEPSDRRTLEFAHALAGRHENNRGHLEIPDPGWLARHPVPMRLRIVANVVQHSADTATPPAEAALQLGWKYAIRGPEATLDHLGLLGALARLHAFRGDLRWALEIQEEVIDGWKARLSEASASFQLSECFRLAAILGDGQAFSRAEDSRLSLKAQGMLGPNPWVELARARGLLLLGNSDVAEPTLRKLAANSESEAHIRWSAVRSLVALLRGARRQPEAEERRQELADAAARPSNEQITATKFALLVDLDQALAEGRNEAAANFVGALSEAEPGLLAHFIAGAAVAEQPRRVARLYPY